MADRQAIVEALRRLDPSVPAGEGQYGPRPVAGEIWDKLDELRVQLDAGVRFRIALHGSVGVGKTTELLRWQRTLGREARAVNVATVSMGTFGVAGERLRGAVLSEIKSRLPSVNGGLLLVDGLDLVPDQFDLVFGPGGVLVEPSLPALVAVAPHAIARMPANRRDPAFVLWHLPAFPVLSRMGEPDWRVVQQLAQILGRRLLGVDDVLEREALLKRVALMSGGVPRDAVRILRSALLAAASVGRVGLEHIVRGERELRQDLEQGIESAEIQTLREVKDNATFFNRDRLLTMGAVLTYEDAQSRYFLPHPVLWTTFGGDSKLEQAAVIAANTP